MCYLPRSNVGLQKQTTDLNNLRIETLIIVLVMKYTVKWIVPTWKVSLCRYDAEVSVLETLLQMFWTVWKPNLSTQSQEATSSNEELLNSSQIFI